MILVILVISLILLVGCGPKSKGKEFTTNKSNDTKVIPKVNKTVVNKTIPKPIQKPVVVKPNEVSCTHNSNCTSGQYCIESKCGLLADQYKSNTTCTKKCNLKVVNLLTSDGESSSVARGKGGYTAASAIEWLVMATPDYCETKEPLVAIKILKRNYGAVFSNEVIMLDVGEKSKVIKHPLMPKIAFTLTVKSVTEACT